MTTYSGPDIVGFLKAAGFSGDEILPMTAIAWKESRFVSDARNPTDKSQRQSDGRVAAGVWQIMTRLPEDKIVSQGFYDGATNARMARSLFESSIRNGYSGYRPWGFSTDAEAKAYGVAHNKFPGEHGSLLGSIVSDLNPANALGGVAGEVRSVLASFAMPVGLGLLGGLLLLLGVWLLIGDTRAGRTVAGLAEAVAVPEAKGAALAARAAS